MSYDLSHLAVWLILAALVGAVVGWREYDAGPQGPWWEGDARRAAVAWVVALAATLIHLLSGRLAFWVESAALFFAAYVIGALIGGSDYLRAFAGARGPVLALAGAAPPVPVAGSDEEEAHIQAVLSGLPKDATAEQKADAVGRRPPGLEKPRGDAADDLQRIRGVGPVNQRNLNALGIFHFDQIAAWSRAEIRWVGAYLSFPGRIDRENWVAQADNLARGGKGSKESADA